MPVNPMAEPRPTPLARNRALPESHRHFLAIGVCGLCALIGSWGGGFLPLATFIAGWTALSLGAVALVMMTGRWRGGQAQRFMLTVVAAGAGVEALALLAWLLDERYMTLAVVLAAAAAIAEAIARRPQPQDEQDISKNPKVKSALARLGESSVPAGIPVEQIASDPPRPPRAGCYVPWGTPGRIVINPAALDDLSEVELAAALAHERAHLLGDHDTKLRLTIAAMRWLTMFIPAAVGLYLHLGSGWLGQVPATIATVLLWGVCTALFWPVPAMVARRQERQASLDALRAVGDAAAWKSALKKLAGLDPSAPAPQERAGLMDPYPTLSETLELENRASGFSAGPSGTRSTAGGA